MPGPADAVMDLIFGRWRSQILHAGVELGVFEVLTDGPRAAEEVAGTLDLDPDNTYRLLRALGALRLLEERPDGTFRIIEKGKLLTADHPRSLRGVALLEESPEHYALWTHLPEFVRTGEQDAFEEEHGHRLFEYPEEDPEYSRAFDEAMTSYSRIETLAVLEALDEERLSGVDHLCNVADGYLMKHVLHDWSDRECVEILENIRSAAPEDTPVFVAELVVPGPDTPHFAKLFDIHMMVATTGRERTVEEYGKLFDRAGLTLAGHHQAEGHPMSVVEGRT